MAHRQFALSDVQAAKLRQAYRTTKDGSARTRYQAIRLYGTGYSVPHIQELTGCSRTSLMEWCRRSCTSGLAGLSDGRVGGNRAKLTRAQRQTIGTKLHQYTPRQLFGGDPATRAGHFWTIADLKRAVQQWVGVTWTSNSSYLTLLTDCGFAYQRTQKVVKSRNEAHIVAFEEQLEKTD